jgi:hypothetical protein
LIKKLCYGIPAGLWTVALLVPAPWLQHVTWRIDRISISAYYLLFALPTFAIVFYTLKSHVLPHEWSLSGWLLPFICVPGIIFGVAPLWALRQWASLWLRGLALGAALVPLLQSELDRERLLKYMYFVSVFMCVIGLFEMIRGVNPLMDVYKMKNASQYFASSAPDNALFHRPSEMSVSAVPTGTQGNRIPFIACISAFLPLAFWRWSQAAKWRNLHALIAGGMMILILWSKVRSSWVGAAAGLLVYGYFSFRTNPRRAAKGSLLLVLVGGISLGVPAVRSAIFTRTASFTRTNRDIQHRLGSLPVVHALDQHSLWGVGYGNYGQVYKPYYTGPFSFLDTPDNQYLRWLIENGILGLAALMVFLIGVLRMGISLGLHGSESEQTFYLAVFASWLTLAITFFFFDGFYWTGPNMTFWCLSGILTSGYALQSKKGIHDRQAQS